MGTVKRGRIWDATAGDPPPSATDALRLATASRHRPTVVNGPSLVGFGLLGAILVILIALASRPSAATHGTINHTPAAAWTIVLTVLLLVGIVDLILLAVIIYAFLPERRRKGSYEWEHWISQLPRVHWIWKLLVVTLPFLLAAGLVVLAAVVSHGPVLHSQPGTPLPLGTIGSRHHAPHPGQPGTDLGSPGVDWIEFAAAALLALTALSIVVWSTRASPLSRREKPRLARDLAAALEDSLEDVRSEVEPRRAVIAAYAKMERILAAHGSPRYEFEAPLEYLARVFRGLKTDVEALRALTDLFELAKFSHHEVSLAMKERAISALTMVRDALRGAA